ncbi:B12 binding domain-containing protein [Formivibrio citricus]|uniref:B12 binding domain-containing protein n=2 Tax=Formivibrio citricus TaxID=83765 RepID=A0A1I4XWZ6_9NEIS|nr:B12 binding domain-containing protein [Formivibrio citricus]
MLTKSIKSELSIPIIWGGAHVNVMPGECLRHADMVCVGEGEEAFLDLLNSISRNGEPDTSIKNIWFNTPDGIIKNEIRPLEENLDKYPYPDFDFENQFVMNATGLEPIGEKHFSDEYSIITSRGCPYRCKYCYNSYRWKQYEGKGRYLRTRSIENVIDELEIAKKLFPKLKKINFWDDSFVARKTEDFVKFKNLYLEKINLPFFALIEPMAFKFDKIKILKECGLCSLQVGIQSGSERVNRDVYNRAVPNVKNIEVARQINSLGIDVTYDLIFNNPYEFKSDIKETIDLFLQFPRPFWLQGFNLIFYPGTELTDRAVQDGYIAAKNDEEDYSTIQDKSNSPISMGGGGKLSERFYAIKYNSDEKEYLNSVLSLIAYRHIPAPIIRYFAASENALKRMQLRLFVGAYIGISKIKNRLLHPQ